MYAAYIKCPWMPTNPKAEADLPVHTHHVPIHLPLLGLTQFKATITAAPHMLILH